MQVLSQYCGQQNKYKMKHFWDFSDFRKKIKKLHYNMKQAAKTHKLAWICTRFKHNKDAAGARDSLRCYDSCVPSFEITSAPAAQTAERSDQ